jgi:short-subunit dehydrogenase
MFEVNYFGLVKALKAVVPSMRERRSGRIIAVSSLAAENPIPFDAPYSASKAAMNMTMRELAIELKPFNIKVTTVMPGGVSTKFTFKRKVYDSSEAGEYADAMQRAVSKLDRIEQTGHDPRVVAEKIVAVVGQKNPPERTAIGFKNKAARIASKILPASAINYINRTTYGQQ